ncbi:MAG: hypothetical protein J5717_02010 [Lachnospiraceae bacterium]|nr:hypothetical protein [Lachnospiraceae bacterium]
MNVKEKLLQIVSDVLERPMDEIEMSMKIGDIDGWDSLKHAEIIERLIREMDLNIEIYDKDLISLMGIYNRLVGQN